MKFREQFVRGTKFMQASPSPWPLRFKGYEMFLGISGRATMIWIFLRIMIFSQSLSIEGGITFLLKKWIFTFLAVWMALCFLHPQLKLHLPKFIIFVRIMHVCIYNYFFYKYRDPPTYPIGINYAHFISEGMLLEEGVQIFGYFRVKRIMCMRMCNQGGGDKTQ